MFNRFYTRENIMLGIAMFVCSLVMFKLCVEFIYVI